MISNHPPRLSLPAQDRAVPLACPAAPAALAEWLELLPKTDLGQNARALFKAISDLNRTVFAPTQRLQLLEILRPAIYYAVTGLRRHYLHQPVVLSEQAGKVARLAQVLLHETALGYALVAVQALAQEPHSGLEQPQQAIATALHRAVTDETQNLLRTAQLYRPAPRGCWQLLHQLAALAWQQRLQHSAVTDPQCGDGTLEATYLRALLLGSANPYRLRQDDLAKLFGLLPEWSRLVSLCGDSEGLFAIDPQSDDGPVYRHYFRPTASQQQVIGLDTCALAEHLEQLRQANDEAAIAEQPLSDDLLAHLVQTWTAASTRTFQRMDTHEPVEIALGLAATHHFCAGEMDFALLVSKDGYLKIHQQQDNPFLRVDPISHESRPPDVWDSPFSNAGLAEVAVDRIDYNIRKQYATSVRAKDRDKYLSHRAETINISPGGFCLKWPQENPAQIRTGEIVGIREHNHKNWRIGVIRWVRLAESDPHLGIELLGPSARPFGARVVQKTGPQGEFQRVLVLPEIKATGQPMTLITPRLPFRSGQKVILIFRDREARIQLVRRVATTAACSQFEFRRLANPVTTNEQVAQTPGTGAGFDSLWDNF